ncbi:hypothetical protein PsorP6_003660 [Peronosclerospora sorghi]|uniref:Uncharacterized protein n=1 Tax=Peronosclerospora sorghi TaxID=230839 RepID=A0ACC0VL57_9STRA|nr:hypothetical protein PsorP6_003660 [Peronosclerospora sorghi]
MEQRATSATVVESMPSPASRIARQEPPVLVFYSSRSNVEHVTRQSRSEQVHVAPLNDGQYQDYRNASFEQVTSMS